MKATVFMDSDNSARQTSNVFRMWLRGADVQPTAVERGEAEDAREAALKYWARNPAQSLMVFGLEGAPEPYPLMAREFASSIGRECLRQVRVAARRAPDLVVARGGNNADALGLFPPMIAEKQIRLVCVEPLRERGQADVTEMLDPTKHQLPPEKHKVAQSILEGTEYPSVVREHRWLRETGRIEYASAGLDAAKKAIRDLSYFEGITPAIETAHALGWACQAAAAMQPDQVVVLMMAEDAEKDIWDIGRLMGAPM